MEYLEERTLERGFILKSPFHGCVGEGMSLLAFFLSLGGCFFTRTRLIMYVLVLVLVLFAYLFCLSVCLSFCGLQIYLSIYVPGCDSVGC